MPLPLHLDAQDANSVPVRVATPLPRCAYCARPGAMFAEAASEHAACALCVLASHLGRPRIDEEAVLIWLPEMDQRVINALCREIHLQLRALHEPLHDDALPRSDTPETRRGYQARAALRQRIEPAAARLGTDRPSELGQALRRLAPAAKARRAELLSGLRLLPRGRFYEDGADIYPAIVAVWRGASIQSAGA